MHRAHIYLGGRTLEALDRIAHETGRSRSEIVAAAVARYSEQHEVLARLERIEALLREGAVVASGAPAPAQAQGESDADRSMALLRAWGVRGDDNDEDTEEA